MYNLNVEELLVNKLTGLPNLFALSKTDMPKDFGHKGTIIVTDVMCFNNINVTYGREVGDQVLIGIARALKKVALDYKALVYHTTGDEYTVILQDHTPDHALAFMKRVIDILSGHMKDLLGKDIGLHFHTFIYEEAIKSISQFFALQFKNRESEGKFSTETIFHDLMWRYEKNINELFRNLERASHMALNDDVSGLKNHRAAKQYLNNLNQETPPGVILFIDGDNLKRYNNVSYQAGNEMIAGLAGLIRGNLRSSDEIFRWLSGDEFVVVLRSVSITDAKKIADSLRLLVENQTRDWLYPITISIGVAALKDQDNWQEAIDKAEKANAHAKVTGKNQVVLYENIN